ncbi:MAG: hypothetical protein DI629_09165 [Mesorhizobium amorphae]|nr:MAG: hypothetical protein DI629_09165 [Mesorhizobium amorphae]
MSAGGLSPSCRHTLSRLRLYRSSDCRVNLLRGIRLHSYPQWGERQTEHSRPLGSLIQCVSEKAESAWPEN